MDAKLNCQKAWLISFGFEGKTDRCTYIYRASYMNALAMGFNDMFANR